MSSLRQLLVILLIALGTLLSGYFFYASVSDYRTYRITQKSDKYIIFSQNLERFLNSVWREEMSSALYLGYRGKIPFDDLTVARKETDRTLNDLAMVIAHYPDTNFYFDGKEENLRSDLEYVRSRVDVLSPEYREILIGYYRHAITQPLLQLIDDYTTTLAKGLPSLRNQILLYQHITHLESTLSQEKSWLLFFSAGGKPILKSDLATWETLVAQSRQSIVSLPESPDFSPRQTESTLGVSRIEILRGAAYGNYQVDLQRWLDTRRQIETALAKASNTVSDNVLTRTMHISVSFDEVVIDLFFGLLFLLMSGWGILRMWHISSRRKNRYRNSEIQLKSQQQGETLQIPVPTTRVIPDTKIKKALQSTDDLPLTNEYNPDIVLKSEREKERISTLQETIFNPVHTFVRLTRRFLEESEAHGLKLHYYIDPKIPSLVLGDEERIKQLMTILINYTCTHARETEAVSMRIENIASTKLESAVKVDLKLPSVSFSREDIREIIDAKYTLNLPKEFNPHSDDLKLASKLLHRVKGELEIDTDSQGATHIIVTLALLATSFSTE